MKMRNRWILVVGLVLSLLLGVFGFTLYTKPPVIETTKVSIPFGEKFDVNEEVKTSEDVVKKEVTKGNVDTSKIGYYEIEVEVSNKRKASAQGIVQVHVFDNISPDIKVKERLVLEVKEPFDLKDHVKVIDNVDGNLIDSLSISDYHTDIVNNYQVVLSVIDSSNNKTTKTVELDVRDTTKPQIIADNKEVVEGESLDVMKGVSAIDNADGDVTKHVQVKGEVNTKKPGTYPITYSVKDNSNNEQIKKVTITVNPKPVALETPLSTSNATTNKAPQKTSSTKETNKQSTESKPKAKEAYEPMSIYFNGQRVTYVNGGKTSGQSIIDSSNRASTWGGASVFSGTDGLNTHFIGHNPGIFTGIWNATSFIITDNKGTPYTYQVTKVYKVDDDGIETNDGVDYFERIAGTGGGERVTFQTCINDTINYIIEASIK